MDVIFERCCDSSTWRPSWGGFSKTSMLVPLCKTEDFSQSCEKNELKQSCKACNCNHAPELLVSRPYEDISELCRRV